MPTNVSTSFFFINLLFQARRAGSNPRPSCIPRCVAARDKSRPGRRAMARAHQEGCARSRPSAWVLNSRCVAARDKSRPWRRAMARAHQEGCARSRPSAWALNSRCVAARDKSRPWQLAIARPHQEGCARARGVVGRGLEKAGILCGAWPRGTSRVHGGGLMARAYQEDCARPRPSAWVLNSRCVAARDKSRPWRRAYGSCLSRELCTCAGCGWSGIGRA